MAMLAGVKIHGDAGGVQAVQKFAQREGDVRPCLDGEMSVHAVRIAGKLAAGLLHHMVALRGAVERNDADVGRHDVRAELLGQIQNALGALDEIAV